MKCRGCNVINYQSAYELTTEEWKEAFDIMSEYGVGFVVLFGGEPTLRDDLPELVRYLNRIDIPHTVITNSKRLLEDDSYYNKLIEAKPFGISCSINEVSHGKTKYGDELKSTYGVQLIEKVRRDLPECDVVANMAVHKQNLIRLPRIIQWLTDHNIWAILTFIHLCKPGHSQYWWYRGPEDDQNKELKLTMDDAEEVREVAEWFEEHYDDLLLHNSKHYFSTWDGICIAQDWKCHSFTNPNINPDGTIMACIDRPLTRPINILDLPEKEGELLDSFEKVIADCPGCMWDHMYETNRYARLGQVEKAKKIFAHKEV